MLGTRALKLLALLPWLLLLVWLPLYPNEVLAAALRGVSIWWEVLFPALFPFFVIAELLLGFGLVHFIGCIFDPMMRPLFRVPGYGGFVMAMGFASGYPIGARLTSQLWQENLVNREEGERLVAFTSTSDPVFLIGAVSVGFFHDAGLAIVLAAAHYGGGLIVGLLMRWHGKSAGQLEKTNTITPSGGTLLRRAFAAMHQARLEDQRSTGALLQEAIRMGLRMVFMIGALVVFISVILELLSLTGVLTVLYAMAAMILNAMFMPEALSRALIDGLFEVTLGAKAAGVAAHSASFMHSTAAAAFILSWAGISVHAQIMSLLTHTNLRYTPFVIGRLLHGLIAGALVYVLWQPLTGGRLAVIGIIPVGEFGKWTWSYSFHLSVLLFAGSLLSVLLLYALYVLFSPLISFMMRKIKG